MRDALRSGRFTTFRAAGETVLFRIDGLVVTLDDVLADAFDGRTAEELWTAHSEEAIERASADLEQLHRAGVFDLGAHVPAAPHAASSLTLMVAQNCNLTCTYCYGGEGTYGSRTKTMSTEVADQAVDMLMMRAPGRRRYAITFFGGEPLLNFPVIVHTVERCRELAKGADARFRYSITTNGTVMTDRIIDFLAEHRFSVMISYDGPHGRHRRFRNGRPSSSRVEATIARLAARGIDVQVRATITSDNMEVREIIDQTTSLGARHVAMSTATPPPTEFGPRCADLAPSAAQQSEFQQMLREVARDNVERAIEGKDRIASLDPYAALIRNLVAGQQPQRKCGVCAGAAAVSTEGAIYPCHRFVGLDDYVIGDIRSGIAEDRANSFFASRDAASDSGCLTCWAREICDRGCPFTIADGKGGFVAPSEDDCVTTREGVRFAVEMLLAVRAAGPEAAKRYLSPSSRQLPPATSR